MKKIKRTPKFYFWTSWNVTKDDLVNISEGVRVWINQNFSDPEKQQKYIKKGLKYSKADKSDNPVHIKCAQRDHLKSPEHC